MTPPPRLDRGCEPLRGPDRGAKVSDAFRLQFVLVPIGAGSAVRRRGDVLRRFAAVRHRLEGDRVLVMRDTDA